MQTTQIRRFADESQETSFTPATILTPPEKQGRWWRRSVRRSYAGQSLAEFAISLPFLIFLLLALVELGFLVRGHLTVTYAVREGVRSATQAGDYPQLNSVSDVNPYGLGVAPGYTDLTRVPPGNDGDTVLVANVSSALQEKLNDAYLLMTYRADSSDSGAAGLIAADKAPANPTTGPFTRWGVYYAPPDASGSSLPYLSYSRAFSTTAPYQRVFQPITETKYVTVNAGGTKQATVPYVRQGWLAGVMDGRVYSYTISLPFTLPTAPSAQSSITFNGQAGNTLLDQYTIVRGIVPPVNDPYAQYSNQLLIWRATSPCPKVDPMWPVGKYSGILGRTITAADLPGGAGATTGFCGSNNPINHVNPNITPYTKSSPEVIAAFVSDPWYPVWRKPGGSCDILRPATAPGANYYNDPTISPHWLGVRLDYKHYYLTNWFGQVYLNLTDRAVKVLEPVPRPGTDWKTCGG